MATPKPGQIRCPTCHQSTPPAAYCTQCGSPVPEQARARPRGLDREELQSRIRARRSGLPVYRRGEGEVLGYAEPYEPEPEDARALRPADRSRPAPPPAPVFDERAPESGQFARRGAFVEDEPRPARPREADAAEEPGYAVPAARPEPEPQASHGDATADDDGVYVDEDYDQYDYAPDEAYEPYEEERRSSPGLMAVVGFLALGGLALLGGAVLWSLMGGDDDVGLAPTPTPVTQLTPAPTPQVPPAQTPGATPAPGPQETPTSVVFDDGFEAQTQPCVGTPDLSQHAQGCNSNGSTNDGSLWVWIGFQRGTDADVLGLRVLDDDGELAAPEETRQLSVIRCGERCNGWIYFSISGLAAGDYRVEVSRNGQFATSTTFTVSS